MENRIRSVFPSMIVMAVMVSVMLLCPDGSARAKEHPDKSTWARLNMPFIENTGQMDSRVAYYADTFGGRLFVSQKGEMVLAVRGEINGENGKTAAGAIIHETLAGAHIKSVTGQDPGPARANFFIGNDPAHWRTSVATYNTVSLGRVYKDIEMHLKPQGNNVEKLFYVHPGGNPSQIEVNVRGTKRLAVDAQGRLILHTPHGKVAYTRPVAYQEIDGERKQVEVAYKTRGRTYGFVLGDYDPAQCLVIDPLLQATYLGGSDTECLYDMIFNADGNVFVAGYADSDDWPGTAGAYQTAVAGNYDAFVALLNADLTAIEQMTYVGGSSSDRCYNIALHPTSGEIYIAGSTYSNDFPGITGGAQTGFAGDADFFVARLSADLTALSQATYLGGDRYDFQSGMAIHPVSGDVYVAGYTYAPHAFPGTAGGAQAVSGGGVDPDAVVARLSADLSTFYQATYIGGSETDSGRAKVCIHADNGDVYVVGNTYSDDLPATAGGAQATSDSSRNTYIARLNPGLTAFTQVTYLGGTGSELDYACISVEPSTGKIFVANNTYSDDFPGTTGGYQTTKQGSSSYDVVIARLNESLTDLEQSTYLGGTDDEVGPVFLAFNEDNGELIVAGPTSSDDFPGTTGGIQPNHVYSSDAFIARMDRNLTTLYQSTYLGGNGGDDPYAMGIHPTSGNIYIAGQTTSDDFPGVTGGIQETFNPGYDIYAACLTSSLTDEEPDITVSPAGNDFGDIEVGSSSAAVTFTITNDGDDDLSVTDIDNSNTTDFTVDTGGGGCGDSFVLAPAASCTITATFHPSATGGCTGDITISSDDPDEPSLTVSLSGTGVVLEPDIGVAPVTRDFGGIDVGGSSAATTFTISNVGDDTLSVTDIDNSNTTDFTVDTGGAGCGDSFFLDPAESCTITATFHPATAGSRSANITISSNDPDEPSVTISLSGTGQAVVVTEPDITVAPTGHDFGDINVGSSSAAVTFTITNDGDDDLSVTDIDNSNTTDFTVDTGGGGCGDSFVLAPAESCTITATFNPATAGDRTADITISSDDPDESSVTISLSGTGVPVVVTAPDISVTPVTHDFGDIDVGSSSAAVSFTITNDGDADLSVTDIANSNTADFTVNTGDGGCGDSFVLAPAASCTITVTFNPSTDGDRTADVTISSDDPDEPVATVTLSGAGDDSGPGGGGGDDGGGGCFLNALLF
ncbi:MAG: choice-of-anchor D domain-containing protein [Thermodesulfobacteriota bacterium]|nr:choice-of-anchor D domain-containing protein [Thermodesulfobacteriota bacterium]